MKLTMWISPMGVSKGLAIVILCLTLASIAAKLYMYAPTPPPYSKAVMLFDLDGELNIGSWYQSVTLLLCAVLLGIIALLTSARGDRFTRHWAAMSCIFMIMSLDEAIAIHERLIEPLRALFHAGGIFYYTWVVPGVIFVIVVALSYMKFLLHLDRKTALLFTISSTSYIAGVLGMEMIPFPRSPAV